MKGLIKNLKHKTLHIFEEREQEMQIGIPTDVKHVAHIGWDGPSASPPSWMNQFKGEEEPPASNEQGISSTPESPLKSHSRRKASRSKKRRNSGGSSADSTNKSLSDAASGAEGGPDSSVQQQQGPSRPRKRKPKSKAKNSNTTDTMSETKSFDDQEGGGGSSPSVSCSKETCKGSRLKRDSKEDNALNDIPAL